MAITRKQVLKTVLLPGVFPRVKELFGSGFGSLAYLIALVYNTVRILPNNHPYLRSEMVGQYSIRQVIVEAANHIHPSKKNIDQIIIFFAVIAALIIMFIQFILLIIAMIIPKANAASMPTEISDFFVTPSPKDDIAYRLLDLVFGVPDFFGSKETTNTALHKALHSLFEFYSYGMIIVGSMIIIYFIVAIVVETAQSGIPFGQRFNKAWAPIRIVIFLGLLIPAGHGLNGGQYITLASAKLGSSLASTGWVKFNDTIQEEAETLLGKKEDLVAKPEPSDLSHVPAFMMIAKTCEISYSKLYFDGDDEFKLPDSWDPDGDETGIKAWAVYEKKDNKYGAELMTGTTFQNLSEESKGNDIHIVFGIKDVKIYKNNRANIYPICSSVVLKVTDVSEPGSAEIHTAYYNLIKNIWTGAEQDSEGNEIPDINKYAENFTKRSMSIDPDPAAELPDEGFKEEWINYLEEYMGGEKGVIGKAVDVQINSGNWQMTPEMKNYGWAGAGIWYNKIAEQNGALITALRQTPVMVLYPEVMEKIKKIKEEEDKNPNPLNRFTPSFSADSPIPGFKIIGEEEIIRTLNRVYKYWEGDSPANPERHFTGNPLIDTINTILGTGSLFEICANTDIHPLAQLSAVGKSMLDSSIQAFMASVGSALLAIFPTQFSPTLSAAAGFFGTVASVGLLIGFILFYVLPFMPFLYFFFAVGGWVKGIFEAMVAMPLWALAHLRIDGEGIPGEAAIHGYFLIFEIFIRPILIVFGLLAAVTIFASLIKVLNETFYLVISNLSGHDPKSSTTGCFASPDGASPEAKEATAAKEASLKDAYRGPIDEFFFTILYTITVYMIGVSCFKLIDLIPNNLLRWMNAEVSSFNDNAGDTAQGLMTYITLAGSQFGGQLSSSVGGLGSGLKQTAANFVKK